MGEANTASDSADLLQGAEPAQESGAAVSKEAFAQRLLAMIAERGWNQSELARRAGVGRDAISTYVRGRSYPEPATLKKLCGALRVSPEQLLPQAAGKMPDSELPSFEIRQMGGDPNQMWLKVNRQVSTDQASRILAILSE